MAVKIWPLLKLFNKDFLTAKLGHCRHTLKKGIKYNFYTEDKVRVKYKVRVPVIHFSYSKKTVAFIFSVCPTNMT